MADARAARPRILIADDEPDLLALMRETLERQGFDVATASDGKEALAAIRQAPPDIAVLDLIMPGCDGFELIKRMQDLHYSMSVIIITGQATCDARDRAMRDGAVGYLQKPFSAESLLELVDKQEGEQSAS